MAILSENGWKQKKTWQILQMSNVNASVRAAYEGTLEKLPQTSHMQEGPTLFLCLPMHIQNDASKCRRREMAQL